MNSDLSCEGNVIMDLVKAMLASGQYSLSEIESYLSNDGSYLHNIADYIVDGYENGNYSETLELKSLLLNHEVELMEDEAAAKKKRLEVEKQVISTDKFDY